MRHNHSSLIAIGFSFLGLALAGCSGSSGEIDPSQTTPAAPSTPASTISLSGISATPEVLLPGQTAILAVTATSSSGAVLSYYWHAAQGTLGTNSASSVPWVAPSATGAYTIRR
jgi:hypothetical protein